MNNKKFKTVSMLVLIVIGIVMIGLGILLAKNGEIDGTIMGVLFGMGAGMIGASGSQLMSMKIYRNNPQLLKNKTIEVTDERNILIKEKSKGKIFDIESILIPLFILALLLLDIKTYIVFIFLAVYALRFVFMIIYFNKYNNIL